MTKINNRPERSIKRRGEDAPTPSAADPRVTYDPKSTELDFFERIASFSPDDWQGGLKAYIYRVAPIIDRKDGQHYLAKVSESFDQDYLLRHWGSGKYHLKLNDARGMTIATTTISCHNPDFPPRVDPAEVVASDPRNEGYFKTWGKKTDAVAGESKNWGSCIQEGILMPSGWPRWRRAKSRVLIPVALVNTADSRCELPVL